MPQNVVVGGRVIGTTTVGTGEQVSGKATPEEIKEKMEQQLRIQRAAHQQKRALESLKSNPNSPANQIVKVVAGNQGKL